MLYRGTEPKVEVDAVGQILLKAADYIEKHGHTKGKLWDDNGAVCVRGAFMKVGTVGGFIVEDRLSACIGGRPCSEHPVNHVIDWNNAPERTAEEVTAMLRHAAYS